MGHDVQVGLPDRHKGEQHDDHGALGIPHTPQATGQNMVDTRLAASQDYDGFYDLEIQLRQLQNAPPFGDRLMVTFQGEDETAVVRGAVKFRDSLVQCLAQPEYAAQRVTVLGPAPCPVPKINYHYRHRLTVCGDMDRPMRFLIAWLLQQFGKDKDSRGVSAFADVNGFE